MLATLDDEEGSFVTDPGALTPNQGAPFTGENIRGVVDGEMSGTGTFGPFYATALPSGREVPALTSVMPTRVPPGRPFSSRRRPDPLGREHHRLAAVTRKAPASTPGNGRLSVLAGT